MLHQCSHTIFNNLSHVLELPWEKYLSEMHEFTAPGRDELQTVNAKDRIANAWSTLVSIFSTILALGLLTNPPSRQSSFLQTILERLLFYLELRSLSFPKA
jgi:hypothetical protein